ncbi:MAG: carboxypeptidase-like regulatory domain-containing protein [Bacteroidota bacterium]
MSLRLASVLLLFICLPNLLSSQMTLIGTTMDAQTKEPIPYVNIGIKNSAMGTVSDDLGNYNLQVGSSGDSIFFSAIGYEVNVLSSSEVLRQGQVYLQPKSYEIPEVQIVAQKLDGKEKILGVRNKKRGLSIGFGSRNLGTEIGAAIAIREATYIKNANFVLNHADGDSLLFRVNIYDYRNKIVGDNLLKDNVLISTKQRRGKVSVDLSSLHIILDHDVLLTLEWIKDDNSAGNANITFDTKKSKKLPGVFVKNTSIGSFEFMGYVNTKLKPCFYLTGSEME